MGYKKGADDEHRKFNVGKRRETEEHEVGHG